MTGKYMYIHQLHMHVPTLKKCYSGSVILWRTKESCYHNHQKQARQKTSQPHHYIISGEALKESASPAQM